MEERPTDRSASRRMLASDPERRPRISIITPSRDQAQFLESALESVHGQGEAVEHIVIDGASRDGTVELLRRWEREAGLRWLSEPDGGQSHAVNKGLALARAPVVGWLNADDRYAAGALGAVLAAFASRPDADVVFGDCGIIDVRGAVIGSVPARGFGAGGLLLQQCTLYQPACFYRLDAIRAVGGLDEDLHLVMDFDLLLRLALRSRAVHVPRILAQHRVHASAKSARRATDFMTEYVRVLDNTFARPLPADVSRLRRQAFEVMYLEGGVRALAADDRAEAGRRLRLALAHASIPPGFRTLKALLLYLDTHVPGRIGTAIIHTLSSLRRQVARYTAGRDAPDRPNNGRTRNEIGHHG